MNRRRCRTLPPSVVVAALLAPGTAGAIPRFAARSGAPCALCHVDPAGGGMRTRYGAHVFQELELLLPWPEAPALELPDEAFEVLRFGGDLRAAYLYQAPERALPPADRPDHLSSFFLMQADLYAAAELGRHLVALFELSAYASFEAWILLRLAPRPGDYELGLKLGRFVPSLGLREVNHDLYTRGGVGQGSQDKETGLELFGDAGPLSLHLGLVNGSRGGEALDGHGGPERSFEKAVYGRASGRLAAGPLRLALAVAGALDDNLDAINPLFAGRAAAEQAQAGVLELRLAVTLLAGLGPLSYVGELVLIEDRLRSGPPARLRGYASAQELGLRALPGLEVMGSLEFAEPDLDLIGDHAIRAGLALELFPLPNLELRLMARHAFQERGPLGDVTDVLVFAHAAL